MEASSMVIFVGGAFDGGRGLGGGAGAIGRGADCTETVGGGPSDLGCDSSLGSGIGTTGAAISD